ncbi:MAG: hypothetical protein EPN97_07695 [Alphaproteobacteria bacterium]|nr:MAG: hypothetical protein EPN97_07695 [Alphaproteobacteria bacterium]
MYLNVFLVIAVIAISIFGLAWFVFPPVIISITFDPDTQIVKASVTNESSRNLSFDDSLSIPQPGNASFKNVPRAIRVKVLSPNGTVLSNLYNNREGWINITDDAFDLRMLPLDDMTLLLPHQTVTAEVKLIKLIDGGTRPYAELTKLKEFCIQFRASVYFNSYTLFPVAKESEVICINEGMK